MKKRLFTLAFAIILCFSISATAFADTDFSIDYTQNSVYDTASVLTDYEADELGDKLEELKSESDIYFVVATVTEFHLGSRDIEDYADILYENYFCYNDASGTVILVYLHGGEGERELCIVRYGEAQDKFSDSDSSDIIDQVQNDIMFGDYAGAFDTFVTECDKVLNPKISIIALPVCLAIGFVIAFIIMKIIASANKSVRSKVNATEYVRANSLNITNGTEIFLYAQTRSTPKASSNNSSGNTSGGGRSTRSGKF